jgi:hypothetical protein
VQKQVVYSKKSDNNKGSNKSRVRGVQKVMVVDVRVVAICKKIGEKGAFCGIVPLNHISTEP